MTSYYKSSMSFRQFSASFLPSFRVVINVAARFLRSSQPSHQGELRRRTRPPLAKTALTRMSSTAFIQIIACRHALLLDISDDDEYDSTWFLSSEFHNSATIPTPWRRLRLALGQLATTQFMLDGCRYKRPRQQRKWQLPTQDDDLTVLDEEELECNDKANTSASTQNMDKDGMFFMAPWPKFSKRRLSSSW
jgi:hypothetical protein